VEDFAISVRLFLKKATRLIIPHFRQFLRFLGLPYCYFFLINWKECTVSRIQVVNDLLYIFFVLRYFPDNYSKCRLFEKPRQEWAFYYGSNYNPFQRGKLFNMLQPPEFQIIFEDKEVCQRICEGLSIQVPEMVGTLNPGVPLLPQLESILSSQPNGEFFVKPSDGSGGSGVYKVTKSGKSLSVSGKKLTDDQSVVPQDARFIIQSRVEQHELMSNVHPGSLNSIRIITLLTKDDTPIVISALARFGSGSAEIDNWSAGGIAVGVDCQKGYLFKTGFDKNGTAFLSHPDSYISFDGFQIPTWPQVKDFSCRVQTSFPFFRLLGLDVAISPNGPVLIEINAYPDFILQEQCAGPLLKSPHILKAFAAYNLLFNRPQKRLAFNLERKGDEPK